MVNFDIVRDDGGRTEAEPFEESLNLNLFEEFCVPQLLDVRRTSFSSMLVTLKNLKNLFDP